MATAASQEYVQKMFIAFLGRAGAPAGMDYYADLIDADEASGKAILFDDLFYSTEGQALLEGMETYEIVQFIFMNVLGREPELSGLIYWTNQIDNGVFNVSEAAAVIADSAANDADDLAVLTAKTSAADATTAYLRTASADDVAAYQANTASARESLANVATEADADAFDAAAEVGAIITGTTFSGTYTLKTTADVVVGGDGVDTVTGTVGGSAATFTSADKISDAFTGDGDILNLSGSGNVALNITTGVTGFETINLDLEKQMGSAFTVQDVGNDVTNLNLTVADETKVVGITVDGETRAELTGNFAGAIDTTNVTSLTVTNQEANKAFSVTGDVDLATITISGANDAGVTVTTDNDASTISISGVDGTNDAAEISAPGAVTLDANDVDLLTLSGNGAAVTFTMNDDRDLSDAKYTITGDQDVTISGANDAFDGNSFTDSSTAGATTIEITSGNDANLEEMGVLSGGLEIAGDLGESKITLATGNTVTISAAQGNDITLDGNDTAAGGELDVVMSKSSTGNLEFEDYETVRIDAGKNAISVVDIDTGANDALSIAGTSSFTANDIDAGTLGVSMSGDFTVTNDVTTTGAGESKIVITADSVLLDDVAAGSNDVITLTATNDIDVSTVDSGTATATLNAGTTVVATAITAGALDVDAGKSVTQSGAIDVDNLVAITAGTTVNTGTIAANDVDIDAGTTATIGAITTEGTTATVDINAGVVVASAITSNDVVIEATNDAGASTVTSITASGDITFNGGTFTQSAAGTIAAGSDGGILTIADTTITIADGNEVSADSILITGDGVVNLGNDVQTDLFNGKDATNDIDAEFQIGVSTGIEIYTGSGADDITANNDTIFSISTGEGNDTVTLTNADAVTLTTGAGVDSVTVTAITGTSGATSTIDTGGDGDTVTIENGVGSKGLTVNTGDGADTVTANDVSDNIVVNLGDGADSITTADATATDINADGGDDTITLGKDSDANVDGGTGTDTLVLANNDYSDDDLVISNIEVLDITAGNDVKLSAETFAGDNTFELVGTGNMTTSFITISATDSNDTTIDASGVSTDVDTAGSIVINGNGGDDVLTHNAYRGTIDGGAGNDTIDGKAGADIIIGGAGADDMTGGAGADDFKFGTGDNDVGLDAANNSMDTIRDFETGSDEVIISDFTGDWSLGGNEVDGSAMNDVGEVLELANDTLNTANTGGGRGEDIIIVQNAMGDGDTYVYIDANNDGDIGDGDILIIFEDATPVSGDFGP